MATGSAPRYELGPEGHPYVRFTWRGREIVHGLDVTKPALLEQGLVFLGPDFERRVPPIDVTIEGQTTRLRGFVRDPEVTRIVGAFFRALEDGTFRPGPA